MTVVDGADAVSVVVTVVFRVIAVTIIAVVVVVFAFDMHRAVMLDGAVLVTRGVVAVNAGVAAVIAAVTRVATGFGLSGETEQNCRSDGQSGECSFQRDCSCR